MTRDLRLSRDQLELRPASFERAERRDRSRRQYMEIVLKNVSTGVVSLDADGFIATVNTSAENLLNMSAEQVVGKNYNRLLQGRHLIMAEKIFWVYRVPEH